MKKFIIPACCITLISLSTAFAQTNRVTEKDSVESQIPYESKNNQLFQNDLVLVTNADIPEKLKQTLKKKEFKGWESGRVFRSSNGDRYTVEIETSEKKTKVYRFDEHGKLVKGD
ncbi:MAG: hypothetical protein ABI477_16155 [Chryseolinea sp.]